MGIVSASRQNLDIRNVQGTKDSGRGSHRRDLLFFTIPVTLLWGCWTCMFRFVLGVHGQFWNWPLRSLAALGCSRCLLSPVLFSPHLSSRSQRSQTGESQAHPSHALHLEFLMARAVSESFTPSQPSTAWLLDVSLYHLLGACWDQQSFSFSQIAILSSIIPHKVIIISISILHMRK